MKIQYLWCALLFAISASAQDQPKLYPSGQFPPGHVYTESDLESLVGHTFSVPTYLTGTFVYLGVWNGAYVFSTYMSARDVLEGKRIDFGKTLIKVTFFNNIPPALDIGKLIKPTTDNPLTIKSVTRSDKGFVFVHTECWAAP